MKVNHFNYKEERACRRQKRVSRDHKMHRERKALGPDKYGHLAR